MTPLRVFVVEKTADPERVVAMAARACYSASPLGEIRGEMVDEAAARLVERVIGLGHLSVLEHASFTFAIEGISRVTSHQLVRHRVASYSQRSQRYVLEGGDGDIVVPPSVEEDVRARDIFSGAAHSAQEAYRALLAAGIPAEDARYLLPSARTTSLVMTMNARELLHFFALRACNRAQWEIRALAVEMLRHCRAAAPLLFAKAGPGCLKGACPEGEMTCGKAAEVRHAFANLAPPMEGTDAATEG